MAKVTHQIGVKLLPLGELILYSLLIPDTSSFIHETSPLPLLGLLLPYFPPYPAPLPSSTPSRTRGLSGMVKRGYGARWDAAGAAHHRRGPFTIHGRDPGLAGCEVSYGRWVSHPPQATS